MKILSYMAFNLLLNLLCPMRCRAASILAHIYSFVLTYTGNRSHFDKCMCMVRHMLSVPYSWIRRIGPIDLARLVLMPALALL